jgi:hypothetical protein
MFIKADVSSLIRMIRKVFTRAVLTALAATAILNIPVLQGAALADEPRNAKISRAEVIARAESWYYRQVPYSQSDTARDPEDTHYRTDCSGFVSMAWRITPTGMSSPTTATLRNYASVISKSSLKAGDALIRQESGGTSGHAVIFKEWVGSGQSTMKVIEQNSTANDMMYREVSLSSYSAFTAYRYDNIIDEVSGSEVSGPSTSGCAHTNVGVVHLHQMKNVQIDTYTCIVYDSGPHVMRGTIIVKWAPATGDDDSQTMGTRFDGFGAKGQLQLNNGTRREANCWLGGEINNASSGTRGCVLTISGAPGDGEWTLDGWVHWDENNDGKTWQGPRYVNGSPIL